MAQTNWSLLVTPAQQIVNHSVGRNADGRLEVFYSDVNSEIWRIWQTAPNGTWSTSALLNKLANASYYSSIAVGRECRWAARSLRRRQRWSALAHLANCTEWDVELLGLIGHALQRAIFIRLYCGEKCRWAAGGLHCWLRWSALAHLAELTQWDVEHLDLLWHNTQRAVYNSRPCCGQE